MRLLQVKENNKKITNKIARIQLFLNNKLRIKSKQKDKEFQKKIQGFKKLKTFIDIKDILHKLNIFSNQNYQNWFEVLKIKDEIKSLEQEFSKYTVEQPEEGPKYRTLLDKNKKVSEMISLSYKLVYNNQSLYEKIKSIHDELMKVVLK